MPKITITDAVTQVLDGTQTIDTLIVMGSTPLAAIGGNPAGLTFASGAPFGPGEKVVIPAGLKWNCIAKSGKSGPVWVTDFGV